MRDMSASLSSITNVTLSRSEGSDAKRPSASCRVRDGSRVASTSSMPQTDRNVCVTGLRVRALGHGFSANVRAPARQPLTDTRILMRERTPRIFRKTGFQPGA
jgi:hypothetical protein